MRNILVMIICGLVCLLSPINPSLGIYGYYWFAIMRPDILSWSGPNNYSFAMAVASLLFNFPRVLPNLAILITNSLCRTLILLFIVISLSVVAAVDPSLSIPPYLQFIRIIIMALLIPLALSDRRKVEILIVVMAASIGLLAAKYGLAGVLHGGARYAEGYGGMMNDNNTMALAFSLAIPLCYFCRPLVASVWGRGILLLAAILSIGGVFFTHSRGGVLSVATALVFIAMKSKRKLLVFLLFAGIAGGTAFLIRDTFLKRMATIKTVGSEEAESSAQSRLVLAVAAAKMWKDYPLLGVGFTETNEQRLISRYVPPEYSESYQNKVIHNTYMQMLADCGIFALILYVWLLFGAIVQMRRAARRAENAGDLVAAAAANAIMVSLITYAVGSTFLSRTSFDFFYVLAMTAAAYLNAESRTVDQSVPVLSARGIPESIAARQPEPAQPAFVPPAPEQAPPRRYKMTRPRSGWRQP